MNDRSRVPNDTAGRRAGAKAIEVSSQPPQLQPPPASGESRSPAAGTALSQQPGRSRLNDEN